MLTAVIILHRHLAHQVLTIPTKTVLLALHLTTVTAMAIIITIIITITMENITENTTVNTMESILNQNLSIQMI
jgi:hypothetical protein